MAVVMTNMINEDDDEDYKDWCFDAFEKSRLLPPVLHSTNLFCLHNYVPGSSFFSSVFLCYLGARFRSCILIESTSRLFAVNCKWFIMCKVRHLERGLQLSFWITRLPALVNKTNKQKKKEKKRFSVAGLGEFRTLWIEIFPELGVRFE